MVLKTITDLLKVCEKRSFICTAIISPTWSTYTDMLYGEINIDLLRMASPVHCEILSLPISKGTVRVFVICVNTPDSSQNVIDRNFALGFGKAVLQLKELAANNEIDMVVICSGKENTFIAGADIKVELKYIGVHGSLR